MTFQKLLVPVDFSPSSKLAVRHAVSLAERFGGTVELVHVWNVPAYLRPDLTVWSGEVSSMLSDHVRHEAERAMQEFVRDASVVARNDVSNRLESGDPASMILAAAERDKVDLIVMGTHGRTGLAHLFVGSVAERVVRLAKVPVLTVRAPD